MSLGKAVVYSYLGACSFWLAVSLPPGSVLGVKAGSPWTCLWIGLGFFGPLGALLALVLRVVSGIGRSIRRAGRTDAAPPSEAD